MTARFIAELQRVAVDSAVKWGAYSHKLSTHFSFYLRNQKKISKQRDLSASTYRCMWNCRYCTFAKGWHRTWRIRILTFRSFEKCSLLASLGYVVESMFHIGTGLSTVSVIIGYQLLICFNRWTRKFMNQNQRDHSRPWTYEVGWDLQDKWIPIKRWPEGLECICTVRVFTYRL